ncbi:MAG: sugar transferase [Lachnospiraceae bacterium]|nr:sugar transferase [Lachnospiraceae bacterium]
MYREKVPSWIKRFDFLVLDMIVLEISFFLSYIIRYGMIHQYSDFPKLYESVAFALVIISIIECVFVQTYSGILKRGQWDEFCFVFRRATYITVMLIMYLYLTKNSDAYSRTVYIMTWEFAVILTYLERQLWKIPVKRNVKNVKQANNCFVIVTVAGKAKEVIEAIRKEADARYIISGIVIIDKKMAGKKISGIKVVADEQSVTDYLCRNWIDEVFIALPEQYLNLENNLVEDCITMGITAHKYLAKETRSKSGVRFVQKIGDYTVLSYGVKVITIRQMIIKRCMDIAGGLVGLLLTGIIFIFIAPMIYIKSPGPIFFKQWRVGRNGKKFQIYKFRSMYMDAEERKAELMAQNKVKDGMMFKIENDPRIIGGENGKGIGNFIRNTSLDEFPQFLNVLKGDMSLVGTRPPTLDEWGKYKLHHRKRMAIKPGLTGMWQVSGRSDITDFEEVVRLDTEYINNWSVSKDIRILLKTVQVVLMGKGAS